MFRLLPRTLQYGQQALWRSSLINKAPFSVAASHFMHTKTAVPPIAIIGGGPCGLTLARLLEVKGIDYVVYEKDESETSRQVGGCLDIHAHDGQLVIKKCGLFDKFKTYARWDATVMVIADQEGNNWLSIGEGRDAPEIDRPQLRQMLLESVPKEKIRWGHGLKSAAFGDDGKPVLEFANGSTASGFKLVVGADGVWSKLRSLLHQEKNEYWNHHYIEATVSPSSPIAEAVVRRVGKGSYIAVGDGKSIIIMKQGDGTYRIYFSNRVPENFARGGAIDLANPEGIRKLFLSEEWFGTWGEDFKDMVRHGENFRSWPLYSLPADFEGWKNAPGVTLAGDAAHGTVPNGEGVNAAMVDAMALSDKIAEYTIDGDLARAVQEYEAELFPRGVHQIKSGVEMLALFHHQDNPREVVETLKNWTQ